MFDRQYWASPWPPSHLQVFIAFYTNPSTIPDNRIIPSRDMNPIIIWVFYRLDIYVLAWDAASEITQSCIFLSLCSCQLYTNVWHISAQVAPFTL